MGTNSNVANKVAAITGAGSGIGRALAIELSRRGASLALSDIDPAGLAETVSRCSSDVTVTSQTLDVAEKAVVFAWADTAAAEHGKINLIFNNAGVDLNATFEGASYDDFEWLMNINFWGVVHGTKAFLPHLKASGDGHVVNISSVFGLISIPGQSAYNAAKFGVRGFTDALRIELEIEPCGVSATTIHPGGVKTNIARSAGGAADSSSSGTESATSPDRSRRRAFRSRLPPTCRALSTRARSRGASHAPGPKLWIAQTLGQPKTPGRNDLLKISFRTREPKQVRPPSY